VADISITRFVSFFRSPKLDRLLRKTMTDKTLKALIPAAKPQLPFTNVLRTTRSTKTSHSDAEHAANGSAAKKRATSIFSLDVITLRATDA
jgi:hypothetical protein